MRRGVIRVPEDGATAARRTPPGLLQTVDRALLVLLGFERARRDWGVTEVAEEFGWDKSVAQRILATLAHRGFLVSDPATRRYRVGPAALHLNRAWERSGSLQLLTQPLLAELSRATGLTAVLAVPDNFHMRCVASVDGRTGPLRYYPLVGELYPAHAGATSKAYYAHVGHQERRRLFQDRPMARFTEHTVTDLAQLERQFQDIRENGYAFTVGEYDAGVATLSVPVFLRGDPIGSISLGAARDDFGEPLRWLDLLRRAAGLVEHRLTAPTSIRVR